MPSGPAPSGSTSRRWWERLWWLAALVPIAVAFRQSPSFGLLSDAQFLVRDNLRLRGPGALWANLTHDYFWGSAGNALPYWRPVTKGSWVLEYALFRGWAGGFHLVQVAWVLVAAAGVMALARRLAAGRAAAALAGLAFGLHAAVVAPGCLIMARSDVVAVAAGLWSLVGFVAWHRTGRTGWGLLHALALFVALGSKETAVVLPVVVTAWALVDRDGAAPARLRHRLARAAPAWLATFAYLAARRAVLGGHASVVPALDPARLVLGGGRYLFAMLPFHIANPVEPIPRAPLADLASLAGTVTGWLVLGGFAAALWRARARDGALVLGWALLALAPVLLVPNLYVPGNHDVEIPLADRWALPTIAGGLVVAAVLVERLLPAPRLRRVIAGALGLWAVAAIAVSGTTHRVFRDADTLSESQDAAFEAKPEDLRTPLDRCDFVERQVARLLARGRPDDAFAVLGALPTPCAAETRFTLLRLSALVDARRFAEALPVGKQLLAGPGMESRYHPDAYYLVGRVLLENGQAAGAEKLLRAAASLGYSGCGLPLELGKAMAAQRRFADAARSYEQAAACVPGDARLPLAAAWLWAGAGDAARARTDAARSETLGLDAAGRASLAALRARLAGGAAPSPP